MSVSDRVTASEGGAMFWDRLWRMSGIGFIIFFMAATMVYGAQPELGSTGDVLTAFYSVGRRPVLIAAILSGMAVLNLLWFAAAIRTTLDSAGVSGWGAAATAASAVLGGMFLLQISIGAALAYSIAGRGEYALTTGLNDLAWALTVLSSFPRAMLVMAGTFGLWRAGLISRALFLVGVLAVVAVLLGGITWRATGDWTPDGVYTRFVSPAVGCVWIVVVSWVLLAQRRVTAAAW